MQDNGGRRAGPLDSTRLGGGGFGVVVLGVVAKDRFEDDAVDATEQN